MKRLILLLMCILAAAPAYSGTFGKVIYVQSVDGSMSGPAQLWERDLDSGKTRNLDPNNSVPGFKYLANSILASPDGNYVAFGPATYKGIAINKLEIGFWVKSGNLVTIIGKKWNATNEYRLATDYLAYPNGIYNTVNPGASTDYPSTKTKEVNLVFEKEALVIGFKGNRSVVYKQTIYFKKPTQLFTWPRDIHSIAYSADWSKFAIHDTKGIFLVDKKGKVLKQFAALTDGTFHVDFAFSKKGSLAFLIDHSYGEPSVNLTETLWVVPAKSQTATEVTKWQDYLGNVTVAENGTYTTREILGWASDDQNLILAGQIMTSADAKVNRKPNQYSILEVNTTLPTENVRTLFMTGKGTSAITWYNN